MNWRSGIIGPLLLYHKRKRCRERCATRRINEGGRGVIAIEFVAHQMANASAATAHFSSAFPAVGPAPAKRRRVARARKCTRWIR